MPRNSALLPFLTCPGGAVYPAPDTWDQGVRALHTLIDPRRAQPWARFPAANSADIEAAIADAKDARLSDWTAEARAERLRMLDRLIQGIEARRNEFATLICAEIGAPAEFADSKHVGTATAHLRAIAEAAKGASDDIAPDPTQPQHRFRYEPLGLALLITPWNWPLNQLALKVGAALVAGCSMILKPSELAPATALLLADCMAQAGVPKDVFTVVLGDGTVGARLAAHRDIDVISFTGSTTVGRKVAQTAAAHFTRTNLELGGKSPNLLFTDCALPLAVEQGIAHAFRNGGQSCNAASRMLVETPIHDQVVTLAGRIAAQFTPAPLVSQAQFDRVQTHIETALAEGARLVTGGLGHAPESTGFTPRPTVFADVTPEMALAQEEVFGPVLAISRFQDEVDAIAQANATDYGLAAYIQTADPARAARVARQLNAGMVQINGSSRAPGAPFGGRKRSGWGREAGLWGIRAFQDIKSVSGLG